MKVQLDKSKYSTVGRSSCLIAALVHSYVCLGCVCVWVGGGGMGEGDLKPCDM